MNEIELAGLCAQNDSKAQHLLYDLYHKRLLGICMRYGKSNTEAEDILQMGMMKIFKNIGTFTGNGSLEGWMKRVVVNVAIDNFRKNSKHYHLEELDRIDEVPVIDPEAAENLAVDDIMMAVQQLPDGYRMVFNLYAMEGYTHHEIAEQLGVSVSTSKTQLLRARRFLMKQLGELNAITQKAAVL